MPSPLPDNGPLIGIRRRLIHGGLWVTLGRCSGIGLTLVANMLLARLLSTSDFGLFVVVITIIQLFVIASRCGLDRIIVRFLSEHESQQNLLGLRTAIQSSIRLGGVALSVATVACLGMLYFYGSSSFGLPDSLQVTLLVLVGLAVLTISQLAAEVLRGFHNLRLASLFDGQTGSVLVYGIFIGLMVSRYFLAGPQLSFPVALAFYVIALTVPMPFALAAAWQAYVMRSRAFGKLAPKRMAPITFGQVASIGLPIMLAQFCMYAASQADILLAAHYLPDEQLALYGASKRLMQIVIVPLKLASLTILSTIPELHSQQRLFELQQVLRTSATLAAVVALVILVPLLVIPGSAMSLVFGEPYHQAAPVVAILAFGQLVFALSGTCGLSLMMTGHHRAVLLVNAGIAISLLATAPLAAERFGMTGIAWVASLHNAGRNVLLLIVARRLLGVWTHADPRKIAFLVSTLRKKTLPVK